MSAVDSIRQDLKYGIRQLRLNPGFSLAAVLSLALGIGANTAIFTLFDQIVLRLLPVRNPRELVQLRVEGGRFGSNSGDGQHTFSHPIYLALRDRNTVFSGLTGQLVQTASLVGEDRSEMIRVGMVAGNFFNVLGVQPHLGRLLTPDDDRARLGHPVVVLQYDFWQKRFAGAREIVGSTIRLNGSPFTVIGVSSPGFEGTDVGLQTQVWTPVTMKPVITPTWDALDDERYSWFYLFGRLKAGVGIEEAQAAMRVLYRQRQEEELQGQFFQRFPETREQFLRQSFTLIPASRGQSNIRFSFERPLIVLQWLVGFVLLIACTNVANLLLARGAARGREIAIRGALGAGRGRLIRQLFVESFLLALAGGMAGLLLSSWMSKGLVRILPYDPANLSLSTSPDLRILLFTMGITLTTALFFGLVPALQGSRVSPGAVLKEEAGSIAGGHVRLRKFFVALQVGLSCLLLIGAGLFARTFQNLKNVNLGFNIENVVTFGVRPATVYDDALKMQTYRSLVEGLSAVPGVKAVGANRQMLLTGGRWDSNITIPGVEPREGRQPWSFFNAITPGYFEALGIPVRAGRDLRWSDWGGSKKLCLINEALVNEYLGGANAASAVGRLMAQGTRNTPDTEIIGVFGDARYEDVRGSIPRQVFVAMDSAIRTIGGVNVFARVQGDPRVVMPQLREQTRRIDSNLIVSDMRTLDDQLNRRLSNERLLSFLSVGFAFLASLLAVIGLHGVLSFVVARRTREIGIRIALGADKGRVIRLIIWEMLPVILIGLAAGVITGLLCGRFVESQLFGVKAADPLVFAIGVAVLLTASILAAFIPAWRASRIDPMASLRHD
ncbi:MAG TPA: ABC transporter permease [Blastocatellia bacterium]|jgi:predicted permease|nr:ABC transporter permease [Blastocatellia bacterium]